MMQRLIDMPRRGTCVLWPEPVHAKVSELKSVAQRLGFGREVTRSAITAALILRNQQSGEDLSKQLHIWRPRIWFAQPPTIYRNVGFRWPDPVFDKLDELHDRVDEYGDKTSNTEMSAFIVDSSDLTIRGFHALLDRYSTAAVSDVHDYLTVLE